MDRNDVRIPYIYAPWHMQSRRGRTCTEIECIITFVLISFLDIVTHIIMYHISVLIQNAYSKLFTFRVQIIEKQKCSYQKESMNYEYQLIWKLITISKKYFEMFVITVNIAIVCDTSVLFEGTGQTMSRKVFRYTWLGVQLFQN